jgi:hypothetical protein
MSRTILLAILLAALGGCSHVDNAATEGKNAFETGMRTKEKAKDLGVQKESFDQQADEF